MISKNKTFCPMAFKEIYVDNAGRYRLCCHAYHSESLKKYSIKTHSPFEFFMSEEMEDIRDKMMSGEKIEDCRACYDMEERGFSSWRTDKYIKKYGYDLELRGIGLKLRINGSYCNLGCYMCFPYNSSTRRNELTEIYGTHKMDEFFQTDALGLKHSEYESAVQDIINHIDKISYMNITGGEPLLLPKHWDLIDRIPPEHAKHISLGYDTNLTHLTYRNRSYMEIVDKFQHVNFGVSCDHYGKKLEWIRYPINVEQFEHNIITAKEHISNLNCTVSILNVFDIFEIKAYYMNKFNINITFDNIVRGPNMLSIKNLPNEIKDKLIKEYSMYNYVVSELKKPRVEEQFQKGLAYCQRLSDHRNFQFRDLWPNL